MGYQLLFPIEYLAYFVSFSLSVKVHTSSSSLTLSYLLISSFGLNESSCFNGSFVPCNIGELQTSSSSKFSEAELLSLLILKSIFRLFKGQHFSRQDKNKSLKMVSFSSGVSIT